MAIVRGPQTSRDAGFPKKGAPSNLQKRGPAAIKKKGHRRIKKKGDRRELKKKGTGE